MTIPFPRPLLMWLTSILTPRQLPGLVLSLTLSATSLASQAAESGAYQIQPGDILEVTVWKERDLARDVVVRPDGGMSFPLAGDIQAAGISVDQLRKDLTTRLAKFIPDPVVNVATKSVAGNKFYVLGKVARSGEYAANRPVDVVQALSMAGGPTPFADLNDILILRRTEGQETAIRFHYGQVERGKNLLQNIILQAGDVVVVP